MTKDAGSSLGCRVMQENCPQQIPKTSRSIMWSSRIIIKHTVTDTGYWAYQAHIIGPPDCTRRTRWQHHEKGQSKTSTQTLNLIKGSYIPEIPTQPNTRHRVTILDTPLSLRPSHTASWTMIWFTTNRWSRTTNITKSSLPLYPKNALRSSPSSPS